MVDGKPAVAGADTKIEGNKLIVTLGDQDLKVEATFKKLIEMCIRDRATCG